MRRREFLKRTIAASTLAGLAPGLFFGQTGSGWGQVPGILAQIVPPQFPNQDFLITNYGAQPGGYIDCRPAIMNAIADCNQAGGGRVVVPPGLYLVNGPIHLLSNVNLYLSTNSTIRFGTNPYNYLPMVGTRWQGIRCFNYSPLIYAYEQKNIAVTGSGVIDGQAAKIWGGFIKRQNADWIALQNMAVNGVPVQNRMFGPGHALRPTMFEPYRCQNILLQGVTIKGSPFWTIHPTFCTNVTITGVSVMPGTSNDDGCDPDSCHNVLIENCTFTTVDDSISLKAGGGPDAVNSEPCSNIVIRNCHCYQSAFSAYTIGTDVTGVIENIFIEKCTASNVLAAIYLKSNSTLGGAVRNVWVQSLEVENCHHLLFVQTNALTTVVGPYPPLFANINLTNTVCGNASVSAFCLQGDARQPIDGVNLHNIAIGNTRALQQITNTLNLKATRITVGGQPATVHL